MKTITQIGEALKKMFGDCAEQANDEHGVIQRRRRFDPISFAQTFILAYLQAPNASSQQIAGMAASCGVSVTKQAIEKRFTMRAARFFESLFQRSTQLIVQQDQSLAPLLERFPEVIIGDSSSIQLPDCESDRFPGCGGSHGSGKSAVKLQTELDLRSGCLTCVNPESVRTPDVASDRQLADRPAGSLRITDLGFFSIRVFAAFAQSGGFFLSRIQRTTSVWKTATENCSVIQFLNSQKLNVVDCWVQIGQKQKLPCRLIAWKVPEKIAAERRRKLKRDQKRRCRTATKEALAACDWMVLVTNLPAERLSIEEAAVLYKARWQIELLFKRWKSVGLIDLCHGKNEATRLVRLWARLCAALIQHWLTVLCGWRPDQAISFMRVTKMIPMIVEQIAEALTRKHLKDQQEQLAYILQRFKRKTAAFAKREKRKIPGTIELLRAPEKLNYFLS